jgi:hypothetical protein
MTYLIVNGKVAAITIHPIKANKQVRLAWYKSGNELVNAVMATTSQGSKWKNDPVEDVAVLLSEDGIYPAFYAGDL